MEKAVKQFVDSLVAQRKKCPWAKEKDLGQQIDELQSEVLELKEALEKNNSAEIREEYGDVLWDALFFGVIAEENGLFSIKDAIEGAHGKLKRRKPWVFGSEKIATREQAIKRWNEIKQMEKAGMEKSQAGRKQPKRWNEIK